jgi:hypothetical protein
LAETFLPFTYVAQQHPSLTELLEITPMEASFDVRQLIPATAVAVAAADNTACKNDGREKCCVRSCNIKGAELLLCHAPDCTKTVHLMCFQGLLLKKFKLDPLPNGGVVCTKKCYLKAQKELAGGGEDQEGRRLGNWDADGLGGPTDSKTSMRILLDWWATEGNYSKFCGKYNNGIKKKEFCLSLAKKMSEETTSERDWKNVLNKIQHVERRWREAHNFATSETGAGIHDTDGVSSFEEIVTRKCPYYYDLLEVMADRASSAPKVTSYDDDDDDDNNDGNDDDDTFDLQDDAVSVLSGGSQQAGVSAPGSKRGSASSQAGGSVLAPGSKRGSASLHEQTRIKSTSKKKARRPPRTSSPLIGGKTAEALRTATKSADDRMAEIARHNKRIEDIESMKVEIESRKADTLAWKSKNDELEYKMNLFRKYEEMKEKPGWTKKRILRFYPDMKEVIEAEDLSDSDSD